MYNKCLEFGRKEYKTGKVASAVEIAHATNVNCIACTWIQHLHRIPSQNVSSAVNYFICCKPRYVYKDRTWSDGVTADGNPTRTVTIKGKGEIERNFAEIKRAFCRAYN